MLIPGSYCSTMAGIKPHFPAVNTCPPSTAMASASWRCIISERAICQVDWAKIQHTSFSPPSPFECIYHNHLQALIHWGSRLALNDNIFPICNAYAPVIAFPCFWCAHCAPSNRAGGTWGHCCKGEDRTPQRLINSRPKKNNQTVGLLVGWKADDTWHEGTNGAHVLCAKVQVGVRLWRQSHQPLGRILEKEVFGPSIAFWWKKSGRLLKNKTKQKPQGYILKNWVRNYLHKKVILQIVFTSIELRVSKIRLASSGSWRVTTACAGTLARWHDAKLSIGALEPSLHSSS